jgi:uncharacterized membrane protein
LAFPLVAGFTLIDHSLRSASRDEPPTREQGFPATWRNTFAVFRSPALPSILALGCLLFVIFAAWIEAAHAAASVGVQAYGPQPSGRSDPVPSGRRCITTQSVAACLWLLAHSLASSAALALCISVGLIPALMLDREVRLVPAVAASPFRIPR